MRAYPRFWALGLAAARGARLDNAPLNPRPPVDIPQFSSIFGGGRGSPSAALWVPHARPGSAVAPAGLAAAGAAKSTEAATLVQEVALLLLGSTELATLVEEVGLRLLGSTEAATLGEDVRLRLAVGTAGRS